MSFVKSAAAMTASTATTPDAIDNQSAPPVRLLLSDLPRSRWRKAGREVEEVEKTIPPPNSKQHVGLSDGQSRSQQLKAA
jgi:hypothetical protein